jgi:DNA-binding LytR/AlgR family response regulator
MKKDRLYFLTFLSIAVVFMLIASFASRYFITASVDQLIEVQVESSKREVKEMASLIDFQLASGLDKQAIVSQIQKTIKGTDSQTWFISVFNWSGKEVCHPDKTKVGQTVTSNQTLISSLEEENNSVELHDLLVDGNTNPNNESEVIFISALQNTDWIVAANVNISKVSSQVSALKNNFYLIFAMMGVLIIILSFVAVRIIGSRYEKHLEAKNSDLASEVINLSKLNADLSTYKKEVVKNTDEEQTEAPSETSKKRILTYIRNELVPINTQDISHIYTENTITYVVCFDGSRSTTNASLDDIYTSLDGSLFFRANRQFIISITAIDKIIKYGNSQLKILVQSNTDVEIIISKNKAAEFKQWLNI